MALFALGHLWKSAGADGGFTWVHPEAFAGGADSATVRRRLGATFSAVAPSPDRTIVSAFPGFRDVYEHSLPAIDHNGGRTLRDSLQAALDGPWPIVQLVTWNDYGEGTMIEPTHEFGYAFLEILQGARHKGTEADRCVDQVAVAPIPPRRSASVPASLPPTTCASRPASMPSAKAPPLASRPGKPSTRSRDSWPTATATTPADSSTPLLNSPTGGNFLLAMAWLV